MRFVKVFEGNAIAINSVGETAKSSGKTMHRHPACNWIEPPRQKKKITSLCMFVCECVFVVECWLKNKNIRFLLSFVFFSYLLRSSLFHFPPDIFFVSSMLFIEFLCFAFRRKNENWRERKKTEQSRRDEVFNKLWNTTCSVVQLQWDAMHIAPQSSDTIRYVWNLCVYVWLVHSSLGIDCVVRGKSLRKWIDCREMMHNFNKLWWYKQ